MNAMGTFRRVAPGVAERAGIAFDQRALFVVEATRGELPGAVVAVANASAEAVRRTAMRMEEIRYAKSRALFDKRVAATFRGETIIRQPEIVGMSGRPWEFSAGIERRGDVVYLLDLVSPRPITFNFPAITNAAEAANTMSAILAAVASGEITPTEASEIGKLVDSYVRVVEATELAARIERLERANEPKP